MAMRLALAWSFSDFGKLRTPLLNNVFVEVEAERDAPFEAAVGALGELPGPVFDLRSLLAAQGENAVLHHELDVLILQAGKLGRDTHLFGAPKSRKASSESRFISR